MPLEELLVRGEPAPILRWGHPVLHRPSRPVTAFDADLWDLLAAMFATNRAAQGAGLAAPQIGVDLAVFVYDCEDANGRRRQGLVCNPRIARLLGPQRDVALEGCLSLPGAYLPLARPDTAVCRGQDQFGQPITVRGTGVLARCLQHEVDHLEGVVFEDHLTPPERRDLRLQHARVAEDYPERWPAD
ncbi:peptide deformylase [Nitriliruptor alkaliphilus]|uniref:peptide deformylase n=1 Tax=Nitriliruptor alkaliphilus TaxID=427918 RepID=UPI000696D3FF|nr:peptide deformylase [Nitriliruptor alkaliphilus]